MGKDTVQIISCSIFRESIERLRHEGKIKCLVTYLPSMLHMYPAKLEAELEKEFDKIGQDNRTVLLYGDCCPHMLDFEKRRSTSRTSGINCCEIILGTGLYKKMRSEGKFFLLREWAIRWRDIFETELGLKGENAISFMKEMHTGLVYIDEGIRVTPLEILEEISAYTGLGYDILTVSEDQLLKNLKSAIDRLDYDS